MAKKEDLELYAQYPSVRKLLDTIAFAEGTDKLHGYNTLVGGKKIADLSNHPNIVGLKTKDGASTAFGRYQITGSTWRGLQKKYGFSDFTPETQDLAAVALLKDAGALPAVLAGDLKGGIDKVKNIWVSLPGSNTKNQPEKSWGDIDKFLGTTNPFNQGTEHMRRKIGTPAQKDNSISLDKIFNDYIAGKMSEGAKQDFEQDVAAGVLMYPEHMRRKIGTPQPEPSLLDKAKDLFTGDLRKTQESQGLPDWESMPEMNDLSWAGAKTGLGTFISPTAEGVQTLKTNFPQVEVKQDTKGNYLIKSAMDGKWYSSKPGLTAADVIKTGAVAAASLAATPAALLARSGSVLGAAGLGAGTQAGIEGIQAATGGEFNPADIAIAGALGGAIPGVVGAVKAAKTPLNNILARVESRGLQQEVAALPHTPPMAAPTTRPTVVSMPDSLSTPPITQPPIDAATPMAAPATRVRATNIVEPIQPTTIPDEVPTVSTPEFLAAEQLTDTAKKAATGTFPGKAQATLAEQAAPDPEVLAAAQRLGIEDYLQPDHVTTNQVYRELAQAVKSVPGSTARASELEGLKEVAKRADDIITKIGTLDASELDYTVKEAMSRTQSELESRANVLYSQLRGSIPAKTSVNVDNIVNYIQSRADDLGGIKNLSPVEKTILSKLNPKNGTQPTYALLDDVRRDLTAARVKREGIFKDADSGQIKKLERELTKDQALIVDSFGATDIFRQARQAVAIRKSLEDDMQSLFGKELNNSMLPALKGSVEQLPAGNSQRFIKLLKLVPEAQRQEAVAAGLNTAFGKNARNGNLNFTTYTNWFEGLQRNKQSYAAIMSNLPPESVVQLKDLYKVSKGISLASKERIVTGRIMAVQEQFKNSDTIMGNIYDLAKKSSIGAVAGVVTAPIGGSAGVGLASGLTAALSRNRTKAIQAADKLISSPEFLGLVRKINLGIDPKNIAKSPEIKQTIQKMARSEKFINFMKAVKQEGYKDQSARVRFLTTLLITSNNRKGSDNGNKR